MPMCVFWVLAHVFGTTMMWYLKNMAYPYPSSLMASSASRCSQRARIGSMKELDERVITMDDVHVQQENRFL